jgi:formamidopyrimidine-DNA glycosylase
LWLTRDKATVLPKLGPEPLEPDFTPDVLAERLKKRKGPIKAVLIDQSVIAGVGNMYADEALFASKIHPLRQADSLTESEIKRLHDAIQGVLRSGIESKGASVVNYYRPSGELGHAHEGFMVAHQRGENCPRCGTPIQRIAVRNRGTYFCPKCQKLS